MSLTYLDLSGSTILWVYKWPRNWFECKIGALEGGNLVGGTCISYAIHITFFVHCFRVVQMEIMHDLHTNAIVFVFVCEYSLEVETFTYYFP